MDLNLFTKMDIKQRSYRGRIGEDMIRIALNKKGTPSRIIIGASVAIKAGLYATDKVDLYNFGSMFAFKKAPAGCLKTRATVEGSRRLTIDSSNAAIEISAKSHKTREFDAWVEEGVIFFKPREEN